MSELDALLDRPGTPRAWFVTPKEGLVELRMVEDSWSAQASAARTLGALFWITKGAPPIHHFPQEWLVWERRYLRSPIELGTERKPIKRITAPTIASAEMWVRHRQSRD